MEIISAPYLLSVSVPLKKDSTGTYWADSSWAKDLALHTEYIKRLTLICPCDRAEPSAGDVPFSDAALSGIKIIELHSPKTTGDALKNLPHTISSMWRAVRDNSIIHTGFGWWPIGEGLIITPIAKMQRRFLMVYIESSFWRVKDPANASMYSRARGSVLEFLYRQCVKVADLRFFTSNKYLQEFLDPNSRGAYVRHASWIDGNIILDEKSARDGWARRNLRSLRFLFAGRLTADKGISLLLEAAKKTAVDLVIIGDGPMREQCSAAARENPTIRLLPPIPYGEQFFRLVREFDAVIVPSLSDEQPRIIFDAFSQAVPVIGADTGGIGEIVRSRENGVLFARGDAAALLAVLTSVSRDDLKGMGLRALEEARSRTHRSMHQERSHLIASHVAGSVFQKRPDRPFF